jgi:hypothetical protein
MPMYNPTMKINLWKFLCFQISVTEDFILLGYDVASLDMMFLMFNMEHEALTMMATCSFQNIR